MSSSGSVKTDQLFKGLTRPALIFGVSYAYALLNLVITTLGFMYSESFMVLLVVGPVIHGIGYLASSKEPLFVELFLVKTGKCSKCKNKFYHGTNSYDVI